ncbi:hypothetical protein Tco_1272766 [Tanacetum coccineum]
MILYNTLPCKEYERVFMCQTAKEIWHKLIITHQDQDYSSKNHARKFLRALPLKWRAKVTAIEEAKDLATLPLDELIGNLKVYKMILVSDGVASKPIKEKVMPIALKANVTRGQTSSNSICQDESDEDEEINLMLEVKKLAKSKEVIEPCKKYDVLTKEVDSLRCNVSRLQDEALNFLKFKKSSVVLDDMLSSKKSSQDKEGLGFSKNDKTTSVSLNKPITFVKEGQNEALGISPPDTLGDAPARHQRASGLSKIGVSFNDFAKPVGPQTRLANTRGKQVHASHKLINMISTTRVLELLHIDLFDHSSIQSYGGNFDTLIPRRSEGLGLMLQEEEEEEEKGQDMIEEKMSNSEESTNEGEMRESSKMLKRTFETMKGYEGDERVMFEFTLRDFAESEI